MDNVRFKLSTDGLEAVYNKKPEIIISSEETLTQYAGDTIDYTQGVKVTDDHDETIPIENIKVSFGKKDNDEEIYEFEIAQEVYSFNSSCFLGLFSDSIKKLGEKKFREKYQFNCSDLIRMNIEDGIRDAVNKANPLG